VGISPHALVGSNVEVGEDVEIGPFAVIGDHAGARGSGRVSIGRRTSIGPMSVIFGDVTIGMNVTVDPHSRIGPFATIGNDTQILYGARVHEDVSIGNSCIVGGNCPDNTTLGDQVVHLGRFAHGFHFPFVEDWDNSPEIGPTIGSRVAIGVNAIVIGPVTIGDNTFILPGEIVRQSLPGDGIWRRGEWISMPNWTRYLRLVGMVAGAPRADRP
jgi:UDP-3-O-[3-hydroxymyristoyl] glucosamine N-acyltransferase